MSRALPTITAHSAYEDLLAVTIALFQKEEDEYYRYQIVRKGSNINHVVYECEGSRDWCLAETRRFGTTGELPSGKPANMAKLG